MKVRDEIKKYASEDDKPVLLWLFERYHWASEWNFVARCTWKQYGTQSYMVHRVWIPSAAGYQLYATKVLYEALLECEALVYEYPVAKRMARDALRLAKGKFKEDLI
jgi:hypothetical protein